MTQPVLPDKEEILEKAKRWFRKSVGERHISNTRALVSPSKFNINPFTTVYLANFLTGNSDPRSIAKALLYPRVLGTSVATTFGNSIQQFTHEVLDAFSSTTSGMDIEFIDCIDGQRKYCQVKAGPSTINNYDVETIAGHFSRVLNLARTNGMVIPHNDLIVGVIYGDPRALSSHYRRIRNSYHYPVVIGQEFWHRLTGDEDFYQDLIEAVGSVAIEADFSEEFESIIDQLAASDTVKALSD